MVSFSPFTHLYRQSFSPFLVEMPFAFLDGCGITYFVRMAEVFDAVPSHIGKEVELLSSELPVISPAEPNSLNCYPKLKTGWDVLGSWLNCICKIMH